MILSITTPSPKASTQPADCQHPFYTQPLQTLISSWNFQRNWAANSKENKYSCGSPGAGVIMLLGMGWGQLHSCSDVSCRDFIRLSAGLLCRGKLPTPSHHSRHYLVQKLTSSQLYSYKETAALITVETSFCLFVASTSVWVHNSVHSRYVFLRLTPLI